MSSSLEFPLGSVYFLLQICGGKTLFQHSTNQGVEQKQWSSWADGCGPSRRNLVTVARMSDFRWHCLREALMSSAHPIGEIMDCFYRVELQQHGSHVHSLFWIENAPVIDKNMDEEVIQCVAQYLTCELQSIEDWTLSCLCSSILNDMQKCKRLSFYFSKCV